jgi:hypothetical protein
VEVFHDHHDCACTAGKPGFQQWREANQPVPARMPVCHPVVVLVLPHQQRAAGIQPLEPDEVESKAIASFGSKELIDPEKGRKVFQQIEKKARHQLAKFSRPFPAANAHFVPWDHVPELDRHASKA